MEIKGNLPIFLVDAYIYIYTMVDVFPPFPLLHWLEIASAAAPATKKRHHKTTFTQRILRRRSSQKNDLKKKRPNPPPALGRWLTAYCTGSAKRKNIHTVGNLQHSAVLSDLAAFFAREFKEFERPPPPEKKQLVALDDAVDMLYERQGRYKADESQHDEERVANHCHVAEVEGRLEGDGILRK